MARRSRPDDRAGCCARAGLQISVVPQVDRSQGRQRGADLRAIRSRAFRCKEEGTSIPGPLVEFYYKDDALNDPFISDDQAILMGAVKLKSELEELRAAALKINSVLIEIFKKAGMELIDFKLEFGRNEKGQLEGWPHSSLDRKSMIPCRK